MMSPLLRRIKRLRRCNSLLVRICRDMIHKVLVLVVWLKDLWDGAHRRVPWEVQWFIRWSRLAAHRSVWVLKRVLLRCCRLSSLLCFR